MNDQELLELKETLTRTDLTVTVKGRPPFTSQTLIDIIDELLKLRVDTASQLNNTQDQLKTVRELLDILRKQIAHYRDRHLYTLGACPDCGDK